LWELVEPVYRERGIKAVRLVPREPVVADNEVADQGRF
jgi:hypothetical protein